ncbi:hypothetical protein QTH91_01190 [Variovorax dokdonensis]|uniref:Uncharacterized protein n=1 Tax=Variovorax dokdonensis TaxID=344883 RepID=A0ABT7N5D4_9BURK|nr:hypothetical protein [Variovorax dokdonensis]MDM0043085.1 hypothetical protein [Variovorax dokdonensis]
MSLLGKAALAMWWDMAPDARADFEHWHAHEHFPERLSIPGFRRASRWSSAENEEGVFVIYELEDHAVLSSEPYAARLNAPSAWSTRMMPLHRNMVRSQCRVLESHGVLTSRQALTIRLSPAPGRAESLRAAVRRLGQKLWMQPGMAGLHLLRHETPALPSTTEQKMRGLADKVADWVLVVCAYDPASLQALGENELSDRALVDMGAAQGTERHRYSLALSATAYEFSPASS